MSISEAKLLANQENAKKSTGPTSFAGRARSAQNAMLHGLCSVFFVLPSESQEKYNAFLQSYIDSWKPVDAVEQEMVAKMAQSMWMSERAVRLQGGCFQHFPQNEQQQLESRQDLHVKLEDLGKYQRYQTTHDRAYTRYQTNLINYRKQREAERRGFVSQARAEAAEARLEKREKQRDERHKLAMQKAYIEVEHKKITYLKNFGPEELPFAAAALEIGCQKAA